MSWIKNQTSFINFLLFSHEKQNRAMLKLMDNNQYKVLQKIAQNILNETFPLTVSQYIALSPHKTFIRKLAKGKASRNHIAQNYKVVHHIIKIGLNHHATCKQTGSCSARRVGKSKGQKQRRHVPTSDSESTCSTESNSSTESEQSGSINGYQSEHKDEESERNGKTESEDEARE